jgi:hypothetical protein
VLTPLLDMNLAQPHHHHTLHPHRPHPCVGGDRRGGGGYGGRGGGRGGGDRRGGRGGGNIFKPYL